MRLAPGSVLRVSLTFDEASTVPVGRLALDGGVAVMQYDAALVDSGFMIDPIEAPTRRLVYAKEPRTFDGLHGIFADSLPDAWGDVLVRRRAARNGIDYGSLTVLDRLAIVGRRGMGAFTYEPEISTEAVGDIDLDLLAHEAMAVADGHESTVLPELERLGGSSGGARPKVLIAIDERGNVAAGDGEIAPGFQAWIVKFRSRRGDLEDAGPLEAAYADMARRAGLHVAPTRLIPTERGPGYFATRRFDRLDHGGRLHVASLAGLFDLDWTIPQIDYDQALRMTRAVTRDQESVRDMFVRMVFNVFAHNRDDHAKQHAFAMSRRGEWSLAPAYDLTFSRGPGGQHYLSVDGHGGDDITIAAMRRLGESQGIARKAIDEIVARVGDAVASFSTFAGNYDVSKTTMSLVGEALARNLRRLLGFS